MEKENAFDTYLKQTLCGYKEDSTTMYGYIDGSDYFDDFLDSLATLGYCFSVRSSDYWHNVTEDRKIWFSYKPHTTCRTAQIDFSGHPFMIKKVSCYDCSMGPKYYKSHALANMPNKVDNINRKTRAVGSKKMGCPAWMTVKIICIYTGFKADNETWRGKKKVSLELRAAMKNKSLDCIQRFHIRANFGKSHNHAVMPNDLYEHLGPKLLKQNQNGLYMTFGLNGDDNSIDPEGSTPEYTPSRNELDTEYFDDEFAMPLRTRLMQQALRSEAMKIIDFSYLCDDPDLLKDIHANLKEKRMILENLLPPKCKLSLQNNLTHITVLDIKRKYGILPQRKKRWK